MSSRRLAFAAVAALLAAGCGDRAEPLDAVAARARAEARHGEIVGRLTFVRLRQTVAVRKGFDQPTIDRGPAWFPGAYLPGEGRLVYVAGHRRTHGGPFRRLGELRRGDEIVFRTPYASATYVVDHRERVAERRVSVLHSGDREELRLQASTIPPGDERLIVFARLARIRRLPS